MDIAPSHSTNAGGSCSHCDAPVPADGVTRYRGRSYHPHCRKCFVCSEIDLFNAETFKGVIFCSACAERIFAECARCRPRAAEAPSARRRRRTQRRRDHRAETQTVFYASTIPASTNASSLEKIIAQDAADAETEPVDNKMSPAQQHPVRLPDGCAQVQTGDVPALPGLPRARAEHKSTVADAGLAELGASMELAQVALRRPSSVTVVIKPGSAFNLEENKSLSQDSGPGTSVSRAISHSSSGCERLPGDRIGGFWRRKRFSSVLKIPFKLFKKNILDKSSFIEVYSRAKLPGSPASGLRNLFHDEISKHHGRGARLLYGTINRRTAPYELGWLHAATCPTKRKRCRHYRASHEYRCLRAHVMKRAGPTRSELERLRGKIRRVVTAGVVCRGGRRGVARAEADLTVCEHFSPTSGLDDKRYLNRR